MFPEIKVCHDFRPNKFSRIFDSSRQRGSARAESGNASVRSILFRSTKVGLDICLSFEPFRVEAIELEHSQVSASFAQEPIVALLCNQASLLLTK